MTREGGVIQGTQQDGEGGVNLLRVVLAKSLRWMERIYMTMEGVRMELPMLLWGRTEAPLTRSSSLIETVVQNPCQCPHR